MNYLLKCGFVLLTLVAANGCAARKVVANVQNDPTYSDGHLPLSGKNYTIQVIDANNLVASDIIVSVISRQFRSKLDANGFTFVEDPSKANLAVLFKTGKKDITIQVPSKSQWGMAFDKGSGGGGGWSSGAYNYDASDEWVQMRVLHCTPDGKQSTVVAGFANPKKLGERLLSDNERLVAAIDKLFNQSMFPKLGKLAAGSGLKVSCWSNSGK